MLGKSVKIIVDRPLGSHHPKYKDIYYSVNYGYVEGVIALDGEEQDAYILGVNVALKDFTGKVIAIIHRKNDIEDKLVVVPENIVLSKEEILQSVYFQEHRRILEAVAHLFGIVVPRLYLFSLGWFTRQEQVALDIQFVRCLVCHRCLARCKLEFYFLGCFVRSDHHFRKTALHSATC